MYYGIENKNVAYPQNYRITDVHKCVYADGTNSIYLCDLLNENVDRDPIDLLVLPNILVLNTQDADNRGGVLYIIGWVGDNGQPEEWEINDGNNAYAYTTQFFNKLNDLLFGDDRGGLVVGCYLQTGRGFII